MLTNPNELTFERWSELSALLLGLEDDAKRETLRALEIDDETFDQAQTAHLAQLSRGVSRGDDTLANLHAENLRRRLSGELVPVLPTRPEWKADPEPSGDVVQGSTRSIAEGAVLVPSYLRGRPTERASVTSGLDATVAPLPTREPALPFRPGVFVPADARERAGGEAKAAVDPAGETLPITTSKEETLPFAQAKELRLMRVEHFAELSFELLQRPLERREILARHGLETEERFTKLAQLWAQKLAENPNLRSRFDALTQTLQQKGPTR
jgi:hypothetical protein